jgi:hypothetical protein
VIKKITIEVIPHLDQRYNTVGDWQFERDSEGKATALSIKVSDMHSDDMNSLIAIHELVESLLCECGGVKESKVDEFDMNWTPVPAYWQTDVLLTEPGEDIRAPYYKQHQTATIVERLCASMIWMHWAYYEAAVDEEVKDAEVYFAEKAFSNVTVASEHEGPGEEDGPWAPGYEERSKPGPVVTKFEDLDDDIPF